MAQGRPVSAQGRPALAQGRRSGPGHGCWHFHLQIIPKTTCSHMHLEIKSQTICVYATCVHCSEIPDRCSRGRCPSPGGPSKCRRRAGKYQRNFPGRSGLPPRSRCLGGGGPSPGDTQANKKCTLWILMSTGTWATNQNMCVLKINYVCKRTWQRTHTHTSPNSKWRPNVHWPP